MTTKRPPKKDLSNKALFDIIHTLEFRDLVDHMEDEEELEERLVELKQEHKDLDEIIGRLMDTQPVDFVQVQRLKKRKLILKDMIQRIESDLLPDIIA